MSTDAFEIEALDQPTFTQVGHWVAFRTDLSPTARHLYTVLATFVNQGRRANGDTSVWPSLALLAVTLGLSKGKSVTPYMDELIQANIVVKTTNTIGGMRSRNTYGIRFNPPPGERSVTNFVALLEPLKAIASDPKAMTKASAETRELIKERRSRESAKRTGRPVVPDSGPRSHGSGPTYSRTGDRNKTQGEQDAGRTTPSLPPQREHADPASPPETPKKKTKPSETPEEIVQRRTGCTPSEASAVVDLIEHQGDGHGGRIRSLAWWITHREERTLAADLAAVRRHHSTPTHCEDHHAEMRPHGCDLCASEIKAGDPEDLVRLRAVLARVGETARPDLARLLTTPRTRSGHQTYRNPENQDVYDESLL
jgi:hypothetical protein